ncbi:MAG: flagellar hook-basal body complex protein FliE [Terracidiphilus sp.]
MSNVSFNSIPNAYVPDLSKLDNGAGNSTDESFSAVLSNAVQKVDQLHDAAATQVGNLVRGGGGDLNDVMIAVEKADVSFQLMMQVRNKIVSAYQDIEKMQF